MAAYPWRNQYLDDIQRAPTIYWPFTEYRPLPFSSPYLNIDGWTRRTYRTPGPNTGRPVAWMLGGSTTWGEGQRDEYTIASWLARLAEADGTPIEISNYGQRGWTHFQEMVLYEQRLALDGPPDMALFYDGVNETPTQSLVEEAVPSHFQVAEEREQRGERTISTRLTGPPPTSSDWVDDAVHAYAEHSLVHKVVRWFSPAAGASTGQAPDGDTEDEARSPEYTASAGDGTDAGRVYERSKFLTLALSKREGVQTLLYWQPAAILGFPEQQARREVTDPTIDISEMLFDHREVFLDNVHTNEEGARLVAERIWQDLRPLVRAWYRDNG